MDQRTRPVGNSLSVLLDDQRSSSKANDGWHQVPFTSRKPKITKNSSLQIIPPIHNKFELFSNLKEVSDLPSRVNQVKPRSIKLKNLRAVGYNRRIGVQKCCRLTPGSLWSLRCTLRHGYYALTQT